MFYDSTLLRSRVNLSSLNRILIERKCLKRKEKNNIIKERFLKTDCTWNFFIEHWCQYSFFFFFGADDVPIAPCFFWGELSIFELRRCYSFLNEMESSILIQFLRVRFFQRARTKTILEGACLKEHSCASLAVFIQIKICFSFVSDLLKEIHANSVYRLSLYHG